MGPFKQYPYEQLRGLTDKFFYHAEGKIEPIQSNIFANWLFCLEYQLNDLYAYFPI